MSLPMILYNLGPLYQQTLPRKAGVLRRDVNQTTTADKDLAVLQIRTVGKKRKF